MELNFEYVQQICEGYKPSAIHTPDSIVQIIYIGQNGSIYAKEAPTPNDEWNNCEFNQEYMICSDVDVDNIKLKHEASSIFVVWKNATQRPELGSVRHRFAVWSVRQDLSKYLENGSIGFRLDDSVATLSIQFENPNYTVSQEEDTILTPGTSLTLFFRSGDSARYIMGRYFVDKNDMSAGDASTSVDGRNAIGKFLKDQTFDEDNTYSCRNLKLMVKDIFDKVGLNNYWISDTSLTRGMQFPPDMNLQDGLKELLKTISTWQLKEDLNGSIGFGDKSDPRFTTNSTYTFERGKDVFSRNVSRDDQDAYARVCVHNSDYSICLYRDVNFRFVMGKKKTLYVSLSDGTTLTDATIYVDNLASLLGSVGVIETFTGPFKPYLSVGDNAQIVGPTTKLLGIITSITHNFGKSGYLTQFVVDSGSVANKTRVSDYINKITGNNTVSSQTKRLY